MNAADVNRGRRPSAPPPDDPKPDGDDARGAARTSKSESVRTVLAKLENVAHAPTPHWGTAGNHELFYVTPRAPDFDRLGLDDWEIRVRPATTETIEELVRRQPALLLAELPGGDTSVLAFVHRVQSELWTLAPPVIALVRGGPDEVFEKAYASGAIDVIALPIAPALLRVKLEHHARRRLPQPGRFGPFRIKRVLGRGVSGQVFLAEGPGSDTQRIALKIVPLDVVHTEPEGLVRFRREIEALRALQSRHVPRFVAAGRVEDSFYCAMEYVEGENLEAILARGPLDEPRVERLLRDLATALEDVQRVGLVHRDVKPSNVILSADGRARLVDFGLAKFVVDPSITRSDEVLGTAPYMAPELARGQPASAASDAFALGVTVLEAALGYCPVTGAGYAIMLARAQGQVPDVGAHLLGGCARLRGALEGLLAPLAAKRLTPGQARELLRPCETPTERVRPTPGSGA